MGKRELIKRYSETGTRQLAGQEKEKAAKRIEGRVEEELRQKYGNEIPTDEQVKKVLFELGSPSRLTKTGEEEKSQKGIETYYYEQYKAILKRVLPLVFFGFSLVWVVGLLTQPNVKWSTQMGRWLGMTLSGVFGAFALITLIVAIFEAKHIELDFIGVKPCPAKKRGDFSRGEAFFEIIMGSLFLGVFLIRPEIFSGIFEGGKEVIPLFNIAFIQQNWGIILAIGGLSLLKALYRLIYARYNVPLLGITLVSNGVTAVLFSSWLKSGQLFNQDFMNQLVSYFKEQKVEMAQLFEHLQEILLAVILFALVLEGIMTLIKTVMKINKK